MGWIDPESFGLIRPGFDDEFVGREPLQGFEASGVIVGVDEIRQVAFELIAAVVVVALDGGFLDRAVHAFDLAVGPGMSDLCQAVFDPILLATHVEHMGHVAGRRPVGVTRRESELDAVVGQDGMDLIGNGLDECLQKC